MITCIALDEVNHKLWYGTPDSSVKCLHVGSAKEKDPLRNQDMEIKGKLVLFKLN
jgi:hypothetical protein